MQKQDHRRPAAKTTSSTADNTSPPAVLLEPSENDIRDYAYHLYQQGSCAHGHDLDNWLEATACLKAAIPADQSDIRLHRHVNAPENGGTRNRSKKELLVF